ncbi:hypothetical protein SBA4_1210045 [Candidatus Sulfopaludibacter sp. SbA4]|nr:hypothetical protein SBA4_1210045 [Candidatus Sulfopaludibacter sp. SbA4]
MRRNHVNTISLGASFAPHFRDRHFTFSGKQLRQMALVLGIQVLNQHECHTGIVRQVAEQFRECLEPSGGGSYTNNVGRGAARAFLGGWPRDYCCGARSRRSRSPLWAGRTRGRR